MIGMCGLGEVCAPQGFVEDFMLWRDFGRVMLRLAIRARMTIRYLICAGFAAISCFANGAGMSFDQKVCQPDSLRAHWTSTIFPYISPPGAEQVVRISTQGERAELQVSLQCSGAASLIPADPCTLKVSQAGMPDAEIEASHIAAIRFEGKLIVYGTELSKGSVRSSVYRYRSGAFGLLCTIRTRE